MLQWVSQHPVETQALSAVAVAFLTLILIVITAWYAVSTHRSLKLLEEERSDRNTPRVMAVLYKSQPAPGERSACILKISNLSAFGVFLRDATVEIEGTIVKSGNTKRPVPQVHAINEVLDSMRGHSTDITSDIFVAVREQTPDAIRANVRVTVSALGRGAWLSVQTAEYHCAIASGIAFEVKEGRVEL